MGVEDDTQAGQQSSSASGNSEELESNTLSPEQLRERFVEYLQQSVDIDSMFFEGVLEREGLLTPLEEVGILPIVTNPNPVPPEAAEQNEQWWITHPDEAKQFGADMARRDVVLRSLYIGFIMRGVMPNLLDPDE